MGDEGEVRKPDCGAIGRVNVLFELSDGRAMDVVVSD